MTDTTTQRMSPEMRKCINDCIACYAICTETLAYCLEQGGQHAGSGLVRTLMDCAEICRTSADFMMRCSEMHERTCGVCARCAQLCAEFSDDQQMQACAEACLRSASSCKQMATRPEAGVDWDKVSADSYPASDPPATMAGASRK